MEFKSFDLIRSILYEADVTVIFISRIQKYINNKKNNLLLDSFVGLLLNKKKNKNAKNCIYLTFII